MSFSSTISNASSQAFSTADAASSGGSSGGAGGSATGKAIAQLANGFFAMQAHNANARAYQANARQREIEAVAEANDRARDGRAAVATGVAIAGASGFTTSGSAADVLARMAAEADTAAARARYEGLRDAQALRHRAKLEKFKGKQAMLAGTINAVASFI
jgi:hypothetical protein